MTCSISRVCDKKKKVYREFTLCISGDVTTGRANVRITSLTLYSLRANKWD